MNATIKAILATTTSIAIVISIVVWHIVDSKMSYFSNKSALMQRELDAYRESLILTGKACKLDVKQLRYELRQMQTENELLKNAKERK